MLQKRLQHDCFVFASRNVPQLVRQVIRDVLERLGRPALHVADMPVDVQQRVAAIKQQLAEHSASGPAVLGLYGMGGIGKTTLASAVFNDLRADFVDASCFLEVGWDADRQQLQQAQRQMLRELCNVNRDIDSVLQGRAELEIRLSSARVLLVIDDIWTTAQLDALLVSVGPGSCVLVTTRNRALLERPGMLQQPVEVLSEDAALELFCWHAFQQNKPPASYKDLAAAAVTACSGLPLTLTVLGSYLGSKEDRAEWENAVFRLEMAQPFDSSAGATDPLWSKLRLSFDDLGDREKQMFLDIACIMLGRLAQNCLPVWGAVAATTLENLKNRSLVGVDRDGSLAMHNQLRDMGRAIVVEEHPDAEQRSRVWMPASLEVIQKKKKVNDDALAVALPPHDNGVVSLLYIYSSTYVLSGYRQYCPQWTSWFSKPSSCCPGFRYH